MQKSAFCNNQLEQAFLAQGSFDDARIKKDVFLLIFTFLAFFASVSVTRAGYHSDPTRENSTEGEVIYIGVLANRGHELCLLEWGPTADYLSEHFSQYEFRILPLSFDEILEEVARPDTRISFVSANSSYYAYMDYHGLARRIATLQVPGIKEPLSSFGGVIFTRADRTDIREITDLSNKHFAAVDRNSLGGWHAALREIQNAGLKPEKDFKSLEFPGTHDEVVHRVLSGNADAGAVRSTQLERMAEEGLIDLSDIRIINSKAEQFLNYPYHLSTLLYPEWPFAAVTGIDDEFSKQVAVALLMMDEDHPAAMSVRGAGWTIPEQYSGVHDLLRELLFPPYEGYGITLSKTIKKYWPWLLIILVLFVGAMGFGVVVYLLKRRAQQISHRLIKSEDALRKSEEVFRNLFENLPVGVAMISKDMQLLMVNPKILEWFPDGNYSTCPKCYQAFNNPPAQGLCNNCPVVKTMSDGKVHEYVREAHTINGTRHFAVTATAITDADGEITSAIEMVDDITDRRQAERDLRNEKLLLRTVIDNIPDSIYCKDTAGRKTLANHTELQYSGTASETEVIGKTDFDLYPKELAEAFFADDQLVLQTGQPVLNREEFVMDDNGQKKWLLTSKIPMKDADGNITGIIGIGHDITERLKNETEIKRQNEKLSSLNAQKDKFFSIIGHDLKSPFNSILGFSELLEEQVSEKDYDNVDKYAKIIGQSSKRAMDLLMNLLEWSRAHTGKMEFSPENFDLVHFINEVALLHHNIAAQKSITLKKDLPHNLPVFADKQMIRTVMRNLTSNAIKFTRQGGEVTISAKKRAKEIVVSVSDNGIGIAPGRIEKLFRIDESDSTPGTNSEKGTGLGLVLCKEFVEKHGGKIRADSKQNEGSKFSFTIPVVS
jgi:PAS domain S-box-containing protein